MRLQSMTKEELVNHHHELYHFLSTRLVVLDTFVDLCQGKPFFDEERDLLEGVRLSVDEMIERVRGE